MTAVMRPKWMAPGHRWVNGGASLPGGVSGGKVGRVLLWVAAFLREGCDALLVVDSSGGVAILDRLRRFARAHCPGCSIVGVNRHGDCLGGDHALLGGRAPEVLAGVMPATEDGVAPPHGPRCASRRHH